MIFTCCSKFNSIEELRNYTIIEFHNIVFNDNTDNNYKRICLSNTLGYYHGYVAAKGWESSLFDDFYTTFGEAWNILK